VPAVASEVVEGVFLGAAANLGGEFDAGFKLSSIVVVLILLEIKSCVRFPGYTIVEALSGGDFFGWTKHNSFG
jgi:hypothetical protein